ncbi:MAG: hypothetical protein R6X27_16605 [Candidatus Desulfacyla sp.]
MGINKERTNMQTLHGKLCVAIYENLGDAVLPVIKKIYGEYGFEVGTGLKRKWKPADLIAAGEAFVDMTNKTGLPSKIEMRDGIAYWTGYRCPFGIENTYRTVCEALMEMDRQIFCALLGVERDRLEFTIQKSLAAGDDCCQGIFRLL